MKRTDRFILFIFCAALVLVYGFEAQALAQGSDPSALAGAPLDPSLDPPLLTPAPTPMPTRATVRPALGYPAFSTRIFYWGADICGPRYVTVSVNASDPRGIASVQMHIRLASQFGNRTTGYMPVEMDLVDTAWVYTIDSWDIPGYDSSTTPWWLQFYFTATDPYGVQARSSTYGNNIVLSSCVLLP